MGVIKGASNSVQEGRQEREQVSRSMPNKRKGRPEQMNGGEEKNVRHSAEDQELDVNRTTTRTSTERSWTFI